MYLRKTFYIFLLSFLCAGQVWAHETGEDHDHDHNAAGNVVPGEVTDTNGNLEMTNTTNDQNPTSVERPVNTQGQSASAQNQVEESALGQEAEEKKRECMEARDRIAEYMNQELSDFDTALTNNPKAFNRSRTAGHVNSARACIGEQIYEYQESEESGQFVLRDSSENDCRNVYLTAKSNDSDPVNVACKHLAKLDKFHRGELGRVHRVVSNSYEANYEDAVRAIQDQGLYRKKLQSFTDEILAKAGKINNDSSASMVDKAKEPELLGDCGSRVGQMGENNEIYKQVRGYIESGEYPFFDIRTYSECISNSDKGLFKRADGEGYNWPFFMEFTRNSSVGTINKERVCKDHAKNYCQPAYSFYYLCEPHKGTPIGDKCLADAKDAVDKCVVGDYRNAKVPKDIGSGSLSVGNLYHMNPDGQVGGGSQQDSGSDEMFESLYDVAEKNGGAEQLAYNRTFHEMYKTCSILRKAASQMADEDGSIKRLGETVTSVNGGYRCARKVPWTVDFNVCSDQIQYGDGIFDILHAGAHTGLAIKNAVNESNINKDYARDLAEGDNAAHLDAQANRYNREAENNMIKSGLSGGHAITLVGMAATFPSPNKLSRSCSEEVGGLYEDPVVNCGMAWVVATHDVNAEAYDNSNQRLHMEEMVFANQKIKENFYYKAADQMAQAAFEGILAWQNRKRAGDIGDIKAQYDEFFAQDAVAPEFVGVNYCEQNPTAPSCRNSNRVQTSTGGQAFGGFGMQSQGGGDFNFNKAIPDGFSEEESLSEAEKKAREKLGDIIGNGGGKSLGNDYSAPGAAKGKVGLSGGGGGGGGGGAGGGGGSKAPAPKKSGGKTTQPGVSTSNPKYVSGSGVNYKGGGTKRSKKRSNAFQNMFGKKKSRGVATTVEDIAPAKSKLFEKISKRYSKVSADKRLYEFSQSEQ